MLPLLSIRRPSQGMRAACAALFAAIVVGAVFWPLLSNGLVHPNDAYYVARGLPSERPFGPDLRDAFQRASYPADTGGYYQPLTTLSFLLEARFVAERADIPFQSHVTNLLLHLLNTTLVFGLAWRLSRRTWVSLALALLFGLHPVQAEAIACIRHRMILLGAFFSLLALHVYVSHARDRRGWAYALVPVCYVAAVLSAPACLTLPLVFLLLDAWPFRRPARAALIEKTPLLLMMAVAAVLIYAVQSTAMVRLPRAWQPLAVAIENVAAMPVRIAWPPSLAPAYPVPAPTGHPLPWPTVPTAVVILLFLALAASRRLSRPVFSGLAGFLLLALPGLVDMPFSAQFIAHAHLYLPLALPAVAAAAWFGSHRRLQPAGAPPVHAPRTSSQDFRAVRPRQAVAAWGLAVVALAFLSIQSRDQADVYSDRNRMFLRVVERNPRWIPGYIGLIESLMLAGRGDAAETWVRRALEVEPANAVLAFYHGAALLLMPGRSGDALEPLERARAANPLWPACLQNLGVTYARLGRLDEAVAHLTQARDLAPRAAGARIALGNAYLRQGRSALARAEFQEALRQGDDPRVHFGLALAWMDNDVPDYARRHLAAAIAGDDRLVARAAASPSLRSLVDAPRDRRSSDELLQLSESNAATPPFPAPSALADLEFEWPAARTARGS